MAGHYPCLIEMSVLDGFGGGVAIHVFCQAAFAEMITIAGVKGAVLCLNDARVMIAAGFGARRILFQVPFPLPRPAFIIRDLHGELVPAAIGVVADENPMSIPQ